MRMVTILSWIKGFLGLLLLYTLLVLIMDMFISTPIVYFHPDTKKCVRVDAASPNLSCRNMPSTYITRYAIK